MKAYVPIKTDTNVFSLHYSQWPKSGDILNVHQLVNRKAKRDAMVHQHSGILSNRKKE